MKQFVAIAALCCIGSAIALPLLDNAVKNGVLLEEAASKPSFAKGIRAYCDYVHHTGRSLGNVPAEGNTQIYKDLKSAKLECDEMGDNCGGILEVDYERDSDVLTQQHIVGDRTEFTLWHGHVLKDEPDVTTAADLDGVTTTISKKVHLKTLCAFPLPNSNFRPSSSENGHSIYETNPITADLRWKLANGPVIKRYDDGRDHGYRSRLVDGKSNVLDVEACEEACRLKSDCASGTFCASGQPGHVGNCFLSGDWDPHGKPVNEVECTNVQNFRKRHDWVKPVMRTDDGQYIKHQWHSKKTIDDAMAEDMLQYDEEEQTYGEGEESGAAL